ncbi:C-X-C motif chemokine 9 [Desmodus rotundus]|uniref:C-X-C motif chemokine 9 n=1 Tax=Desmodus rotundus TaxID=9430 RepID=UPI001E1C16BA|nr:C-X-C motif chemokine 9 [Desmodus rotundus]
MFSKEFLRLEIQQRTDSVELPSTTMKKSGALLLLDITFLILTGVQGSPMMRNGRCSCIKYKQGLIHLKALKDLQEFPPSPSCDNTEIIATMKNGDQTCLNPNSRNVKKLIKEWKKQDSQKKRQKKGKTSKKAGNFKKVKGSQRPQKKTT